jgi:hypothetical protein
METETMEINTNEENLLNQEIPVNGELKLISEIIEERVVKETTGRMQTDKYKKRYQDPKSQVAQIEVNKFLKSNKPQEEVEFAGLVELISEKELDPEGTTEGLGYTTYLAIQKGEQIGYSADILSSIRGVFAKASVAYNKGLKEGVTSEHLFKMLYTELSEKIRTDYLNLVWQLS